MKKCFDCKHSKINQVHTTYVYPETGGTAYEETNTYKFCQNPKLFREEDVALTSPDDPLRVDWYNARRKRTWWVRYFKPYPYGQCGPEGKLFEGK